MKLVKSFILLFLSLVLIFNIGIVSFAQTETTGTFGVMSYNVAGLPKSIDAFVNQPIIGSTINTSGFDIVAVQEDFNLHNLLISKIDSKVYPYESIHTGGVPCGDGLNIFSKFPIYNEKRITWDLSYGVLDSGADELTPKGIQFGVIDLGNGIFIDFYNIHADAGGNDGDVDTRSEQFKQLAKIIKERDSKNPVIVTGDFNASIHYGRPCDSHLYYELYRDCGFHDTWFEVHNDGQYGLSTLQTWINQTGGYGYKETSGKWNSIEKILYKSGSNVELIATSQEYVYYGDNLSDHPAVIAQFKYRVIGDPITNDEELNVTNINFFDKAISSIKLFFDALSKITKAIFNFSK